MSRATDNSHDLTPPTQFNFLVVYTVRLARFVLKRPVRRAFAVPPRCAAAQWGGGGVGRRLTLTVASIEACSIDSQTART